MTRLILIFIFSLALFPSSPQAGEFKMDDHRFFRDGKHFLVKGVVYVPVYPGDLPWEVALKKELPETLKMWIRADLNDMDSMGANTVRLWDVPEFVYQAVKEERKFALIQTIWFDSNTKDLQDPSYKERCKEKIRITLKRIYSVYSRQDPPPILAYIVGSELSRSLIQTTDALHPGRKGYAGEFVSAPAGSSASESFLAEMADYLKTLESEQYGQTNLVSYANEARTYDLIDTPFLDFRSFNVYSYAILDYAAPDNGSFTGTFFQGWIEQLKSKYPRMPLLVTETGLSVSPEGPRLGPHEYGYGGNTAEDQARGIAQNWKDVRTAKPPIAGMVVHEYLDAWWKFGKRDSLEHNSGDAEEWFGITEIEKNGSGYLTRYRPAYKKLQELWDN